MIEPGPNFSSGRWWWTLAAGAAVAAGAFTLMYLVVVTFNAVLSIFARDAVERAATVRSLAEFMALLGLPAIFALLSAGSASWLTVRSGETSAWNGALVGLIAAVLLQVIGLAFGPPDTGELVLYPLLGAAGGWAGSALGRAILTVREALYRASRAIAEAGSPSEIAAAIGDHLTDARSERVTLWRSTNEEPRGIELLASGSPGPADERWCDAARAPASLGEQRGSASVFRRRDLDPDGRRAWERLGIRAALVVPLHASGSGIGGMLVFVSRGRRAFLRDRVRVMQTAGAQAALALENLRLVEQARRSGELDERYRLAREIHDTLIQSFAGIVTNLEAAEGSLKDALDLDPTRLHLDQARRTAREGLAEARRIVWALGPGALQEAPLPEALARLAALWSEGSDVPAGTTVTGAARPLPSRIEATLLRVAQEALTNVGKHAGAGRVLLTLSYMGDRVALDARDDGVGFDPDRVRPADEEDGGFGLKIMRERAERSGGTLHIESEPGRGTALTVELPAAVEEPSRRVEVSGETA